MSGEVQDRSKLTALIEAIGYDNGLPIREEFAWVSERMVAT